MVRYVSHLYICVFLVRYSRPSPLHSSQNHKIETDTMSRTHIKQQSPVSPCPLFHRYSQYPMVDNLCFHFQDHRGNSHSLLGHVRRENRPSSGADPYRKRGFACDSIRYNHLYLKHFPYCFAMARIDLFSLDKTSGSMTISMAHKTIPSSTDYGQHTPFG